MVCQWMVRVDGPGVGDQAGRMQGFIRPRGASWELRVYLGTDPFTGRQRYANRSVRGPRHHAERVLKEMVAAAQAVVSSHHRGAAAATTATAATTDAADTANAAEEAAKVDVGVDGVAVRIDRHEVTWVSTNTSTDPGAARTGANGCNVGTATNGGVHRGAAGADRSRRAGR